MVSTTDFDSVGGSSNLPTSAKIRCYSQVVRQGSAKALFPSSNLGGTSNETPCVSRHLKKRCCFYITVKCAVRIRCYDAYIDRKSKQPTNLTIQGVDTIC